MAGRYIYGCAFRAILNRYAAAGWRGRVSLRDETDALAGQLNAWFSHWATAGFFREARFP